MRTIGDILLRGAEQYGNREALADPNETATYAQLAGAASQHARSLRALGLAPGDRSLIVLPNSVDFVRAHFANLLAGAISVPCDVAISPTTLTAIASSCGPRFLLTDASTLKRLGEHLPASLEYVLVFGSSESTDVRVRDARALASTQSSEALTDERGSDDVAALMFTTGTTGLPKGVMLTHANVLAALESITRFVGYSPEDREVVVLPLSHNFGLGHVYCNLLSGGAVYTDTGLSRPGRVLKALESFRATGFPGTPTGYGMLMDQFGPVLAAKGRGLRFAVINSAPLPPERAAQLQALLPHLDIMVYYGLTEASRTSFASLSRLGPELYRSVGRPMAHVEVQIQDGDGHARTTGESGEVVIRGPAVTQGYWRNPTETAEAFRSGWLKTGDLGRIDDEGLLWIIGRIKDVINVGGYKVIPGDVERVLLQVAGVVDAGAVGIDNLSGVTGEAVVAALVLKEGAVLDETALQQLCVQQLEKFKVPTRFVRVKEIARTNTGKIKRAELAREVAAALAAESSGRN